MSELYSGRGLTVSAGQGADLWDDKGKKYVDFMTGHGSSLFGHCHPELVSVAKVASQSPWSVGLGISSAPRDLFLNALRSLLPDGKAFLCNSGAESMEAAFKLVTARSGRRRILALRRAFHGRTIGALGLTFNPKYRKPWQTSLYPVEHLSPEDLPGAVDEDTCAVFVEPVQGEGGVYPLDLEIGKAISKACSKFDVPLVADEIQSGWGRCGSLLASSQVGLEPDVVCLAKGVAGGFPVGAVVWKGWIGDFPTAGHGTTYGGNPFVSALGLASWQLLQDREYPLQASSKGSRFKEMLGKLDSPLLGEVRGMGLLLGVDTTVKSSELVKALQDRGVLALPAGPKVLRFMPPFVAEDRHFNQAVEALKDVCDELERR